MMLAYVRQLSRTLHKRPCPCSPEEPCCAVEQKGRFRWWSRRRRGDRRSCDLASLGHHVNAKASCWFVLVPSSLFHSFFSSDFIAARAHHSGDCGAFQMFFLASTATMLGLLFVPDELRGRVMSLLTCSTAASCRRGRSCPAPRRICIGAPMTVAIMGAIVILLTLVVAWRIPAIRTSES